MKRRRLRIRLKELKNLLKTSLRITLMEIIVRMFQRKNKSMVALKIITLPDLNHMIKTRMRTKVSLRLKKKLIKIDRI